MRFGRARGHDPLQSICLYCGSRMGHDPAHREAARETGRAIAEAGFRLIYGAGDLGLMGECARAAQKAGGHITGFIPRHLVDLEVGKRDLDTLVVTDTMHERKKLMLGNADAVLALPGGPGTLDELIEALTWRNLGLHAKPVVVLNTADYWRPFLGLLDHMEREGFVAAGFSATVGVASTPADAIAALRAALAPLRSSAE